MVTPVHNGPRRPVFSKPMANEELVWPTTRCGSPPTRYELDITEPTLLPAKCQRPSCSHVLEQPPVVVEARAPVLDGPLENVKVPSSRSKSARAYAPLAAF